MGTHRQKRILVVEDDPLVCEVVVDALDGVYETSRAETAAAGDRMPAGRAGSTRYCWTARCPAGSTRVWCRWRMTSVSR